MQNAMSHINALVDSTQRSTARCLSANAELGSWRTGVTTPECMTASGASSIDARGPFHRERTESCSGHHCFLVASLEPSAVLPSSRLQVPWCDSYWLKGCMHLELHDARGISIRSSSWTPEVEADPPRYAHADN